MKMIRFRVVGKTPLLMNSPKGMAAPKDVVATKRVLMPEEESESGTYRNADGSLYWPSMAFRSALVAAGTGFKAGKRGLPSVVKGSVFVVSDTVPLVHPKTTAPIREYAIDTRRCCVVSAGRKAAVMRSRPRIDEWSCEVEFEYDERFIDAKTIQQTFDRAGSIVGIGNFSPRCSGPFGRFTVETV